MEAAGWLLEESEEDWQAPASPPVPPQAVSSRHRVIIGTQAHLRTAKTSVFYRISPMAAGSDDTTSSGVIP